jgi:recombination protein RecA
MAKKKEISGLDSFLSDINAKFGEGAVQRMGDEKIKDFKGFSSGSLKLDLALGGKVPYGKIIEIFSQEQCGKTGRCLEMIRECQNDGGLCGYIDAENALERSYMKKLGVTVEDVVIAQPDTGEQAGEIARGMITSGIFSLIIIDSVSALIPKAELEGEVGESKIGLQARMMSQLLRMIKGTAQRNNCTVVFINQLREKIGVMYGNPQVTSGGNALKFYSDIRIEIKKSLVRKGDEVLGFTQKNHVIKNKMAPAFKKAEIYIDFETGFDREKEMIDVAVELDIMKKGGAWYSYSGTNVGQGIDKSADMLRDNPELYEEIENKVKEKLAQMD